MLSYLNSLHNPYREHLNVDLMRRKYDKPLHEYIVDSFRGFEILPNIKILGYQWEPEEDKYNVNDHVVRRNSNKNKAIKAINETRCGVLYIDVEVSGPDKTGEQKTHYIKKPIILPIQDENGYFLIRGRTSYILYQLADKLSYPSIGAVTIKSLMPVCVKTSKYTLTDTEGEEYVVPVYAITIFRGAINVLLIYSHLAISGMLGFLEVGRFIRVLRKDGYERRDDCLYFECDKKSDCVVEVNAEAFNEPSFVYLRSIVGNLVLLLNDTKMPYDKLDSYDEWMMIVGGKNTVKRGEYQHIFFNRLLDDVTRKEIKINYHDKQNIYYLLRWILQNYHVLWSKDNLSMINKRLRCNEYVGSLMTADISGRINRLVSLGDKATIRDFLSAFRSPEDIFMNRLFGSGILRYSENNNDLDCENTLTYTKKGPQSLGGTDTKRIPIRQRLLHPSMLSTIDIAATSNSDFELVIYYYDIITGSDLS